MSQGDKDVSGQTVKTGNKASQTIGLEPRLRLDADVG